VLNKLHNNLIYPILEEEQEQQKKALNNHQQQQLVNQDTLWPDTASHHYQAPKLYQTSNLHTPKTTTSSSISLFPIKTNVLYDIAKLSIERNTHKQKLESAEDRESGRRK
jgi:hypothetical protein